jgi:hypothetical protein
MIDIIVEIMILSNGNQFYNLKFYNFRVWMSRGGRS